MCLCEDERGAEEAEGGEGARAWLRAPGLSSPPATAASAPDPRRPAATAARLAPGLRSRGTQRAGGRAGSTGPAAWPAKSQKAKVRRATLASFSQLRPLRRPAS